MNTYDLESAYKKRDLPNTAEVVRVAPSPTGFVHIGLLYMAVICKYIARQTGGVFILRIEDTDKVREVQGAKEEIIKQLNTFGLTYDEGLFINDEGKFVEKGEYGPYLQSERVHIYDAYASYLLEKGLAYKCYMTSDELDIMRQTQTNNKERPGVYGKYAKYHNADNVDLVGKDLYEEYQLLLKSNMPYVIRLKAKGDMHNKFHMNDVIMGDVQVPENDEDFILIKGDGYASYHLAHVIDDRLMGTTLVVRGNEWFASLGKHIALWNAFGWPAPRYAHVAPINKQDGGTVRKLSKRKDNEADVKYFIEAGYSSEAVVAYLLRLANPSFDDYYTDIIHGKKDLIDGIHNYHFNLEELARGGRGPLLDIPKMNSLSSEIVAQMSAEDLYESYTAWLRNHDIEFYNTLIKDKVYAVKVLNIERTGEKIRKDIYNFSMIKSQIYYMFDCAANVHNDEMEAKNKAPSFFNDDNKVELYNLLLERNILSMGGNGDNFLNLEMWVEAMKQICSDMGYEKFGDFMKGLRILITGEERTPNLYYILNVLGPDKVKTRIVSK